MATSTPIPPDQTDEKSATPYGDAAAGARVLSEASEALNGLRELASRVTPPKAKTSSMPELDEEDQLALELPKDEAEKSEAIEATSEPKVSIGVIAEPLVAPEPVAIVIPSAPEAVVETKTAAPVSSAPVASGRKPRVGETLRDARESAGFSLDEVADEIKIKETYLQAIEEGRYGDLPSRTYAVGFVRSYAQALGLHTEELVARCRIEVGSVKNVAAPPPLVMREPVADRRLPGGALISVCVVLAVIVYALSYSFLRPANSSFEPPAPAEVAAPAPIPVAATPAPTPAPAPVAAPVAAAPVVVPTPAPQAAAPAKALTPKEEAVDEAASAEDPATDDAVAEPAIKEAPVKALKKTAEDSARPTVIPGAAPADVSSNPEDITPRVIEAKPADLNVPANNVAAVEKPVKLKAPSRIKLRAVDDTSVRITDANGRVLAERVIHKGESFYVPDHQHYTLATTNAGALHLSVDGRDMPALGDTGEAMHNIPLDAADLLQVLAQ